MGIKGLLPSLQQAALVSPITLFQGKRVAIDTSGWLHKGLFAVAEDFIDSEFEDHNQLYVDYIVFRVRSLRDLGVEPVLVFDGKRHLLKSETQGKREEIRLSSMTSARRLVDSIRSTGDAACRDKLRAEAVSAAQRGMSVTHEMECHVIAALRKLNFTVIVAPYEADAQLAYLCHIGFCDAVLSEDSDILVYSAVSGHPFNVLYKFEKSGAVQVICLGSEAVGLLDVDENSPALLAGQSQAMMAAGVSAGKEKEKGEKGFLASLKRYRTNRDGHKDPCSSSAQRMFVQTCILSGCDYCESINGVGIMTAQQAVLKFKGSPDDERLQRICEYFRASGKVTEAIPPPTLPQLPLMI